MEGEGHGLYPGPWRILTDGSCKLRQGGAWQVCDWALQAGGSLRIRYGAERPTITVRGVIDGDQMWFMQGDHTESSGFVAARNSTPA
jgi:hypothetical protein